VGPDRGYLGDLQYVNSDLQRELGNLKKELELTNQKLSSSMHSIKTFWSPELKKERALRKEESAKYSLINDQLKLLNNENQKQAMLVRQLEEELRMRMRQPSLEVQQQIETLYAENEHLTREIAILRDTIKVCLTKQFHNLLQTVSLTHIYTLHVQSIGARTSSGNTKANTHGS
jgi:golgin subfamily B member 1